MFKALKAGAGAAGFLLVVLLVGGLFGLVPSFLSLESPFSTERVERHHPAIVDSLRDVAEFHAATGTYSVIIDREDDVRFVPAFLAGEREKLIAVGAVDAVVSFEDLDVGAIEVGLDDRVTITLPAVEVGEVTIDHSQTEVIDRDRGVLNRIGGVFSDSPTSEMDLLEAAEARLTQAAAESELLARGRINTTRMLQQMLGVLGYDDVRVEFAPPSIAAE